MERKHKGKCPFCNSEMAPEVIEKTLSAEINVNVQLVERLFINAEIYSVMTTQKADYFTMTNCALHVVNVF